MALHRLPWRVLAGALLAVGGLTLGWLWFRDSALVAVERVSVTGSGSSEQAEVREALETAAQGMSTLRVDEGELRRAVEPFSSVAGLRVRSDFPHRLLIEVREHEPVAVVQAGGSSTPATGGGLLLDGVEARDLPVVATATPVADGRVTDRRALDALAVAAAAPPALRSRSERVYYDENVMALELRDGPELIFGTAAGAPDKWRAAARVLAEESSAGATYLDLRVPNLVAAGGVGPVEPEPEPSPTAVPSQPSTVG